MDFDIDQQLLEKMAKKTALLGAFNTVDLTSACHAEVRDLLLPYERTRRQANPYQIGCSLWVQCIHIRFLDVLSRGHDDARRDPTNLSKTDRLPSDIAIAVSKVLNE
jgi:hypothetical protein